ncbi:MAG: hypothetical protein Q9161_008046 [Pseudevernia consocians]
MDVAANRVGIPAIPSAFIGPARPTSTFLGQETIVAGPVSETAVPIMFRCVRGPGSPSRHVLVMMKPSVSEEALALHLCQIFGIPNTGNVAIEPVFKWMPGLMPYGGGILKWMPGLMPAGGGMDKGKSFSNNLFETVLCADYPPVIPFAEVIRTLGSTMSGIIDIDVLICEEQLGNCTVCDNESVPTSVLTRNPRMWVIDECILCEKCAGGGDITRTIPQMDLGNGYIRVAPPGY